MCEYFIMFITAENPWVEQLLLKASNSDNLIDVFN